MFIAVAVSEPEVSERGSSLMALRNVSQYIKGAKNLISFKRKALWSISGQDALRFRSRFQKWRVRWATTVHATYKTCHHSKKQTEQLLRRETTDEEQNSESHLLCTRKT